jgi:hypothetical protein
MNRGAEARAAAAAVRASESSNRRLNIVLANANCVRHARKYKAETAVVDGFILGFESPRLFARCVELGGRRARQN